MNKNVILQDNSKIELRLLKTGDLDKLMQFYRSLPFEDRKYLKVDVTDKAVVEKRVKTVQEKKALRMLAWHGKNIVAEGMLFLSDDDWFRDQGEIRILVARNFQRKRLGTILMKELYLLALENQVEKMVAKLMMPQIGLKFILEKFGFKEEHVIPHFALDQEQIKQDLLIMVCDIRDFWKESTATLKDGTEIRLRLLAIGESDLDKLMEFYHHLPAEDRKYLKVDVTRRDVVAKRLKSVQEKKAVRVVALLRDSIIAEGELFLSDDDWFRDQGEIRVIVARDFQRKGLGIIMFRELYHLALQHQVEKVVAKIMLPQKSARAILKKFHFKEEHVIPHFALDQAQKKQDLLIMVCEMKDFWKELEIVYDGSDWQRCR